MVILRSKSVAAGENAVVGLGFEADTRNVAPLLAIGATGAIFAALSLCSKRSVPSGPIHSKEFAA